MDSSTRSTPRLVIAATFAFAMATACADEGGVSFWAPGQFGSFSAVRAGKESNWVPTKDGRKFEAMFRVYAPTKAFFDKARVLPYIEKVN